MSDFWQAMRAAKKQKFDADRKNFLKHAQERDDGQWVKHTEYHWSREVAGKRLDYWPSRNKFMYDGRVQRGDVLEFIKERMQ